MDKGAKSKFLVFDKGNDCLIGVVFEIICGFSFLYFYLDKDLLKPFPFLTILAISMWLIILLVLKKFGYSFLMKTIIITSVLSIITIFFTLSIIAMRNFRLF